MSHLHLHPTQLPREGRRALQRSIEQALTASAPGLTVRGLIEEVSRREIAAGRVRPEPAEVMTMLGLMVVSGRVDERGGFLVLCADAGRESRAA